MATTRQLEVLGAVADAGSVQKAARDLGISPASVSQTVKRLETDQGKPLIQRSATGSKLTPAGRGLRKRTRGLV